MNQQVVSTKLLLFSLLISFFVLIIIFVLNHINGKPTLAFCNNNNKLNILLQMGDNDVLIEPLGIKEVLECLGKHMPYYDRTIDIVISNKVEIVASLEERYKIKKLVNKKSLLVNEYLITIDSNVLITKNNKHILICQRPLTKINQEMLKEDLSLLLRAKSNNVLGTLFQNDYEAESGEVGKISLDLFRIQ